MAEADRKSGDRIEGGAVVATRVRTNPVWVKLYTDDYVISGLVHTKPGGYRERVSDIVNDPATRFLVLTEATFRAAHDESASVKKCHTLILRMEDIKLLIPFEGGGDEAATRPE
jgi:hypothetical protein